MLCTNAKTHTNIPVLDRLYAVALSSAKSFGYWQHHRRVHRITRRVNPGAPSKTGTSNPDHLQWLVS